MTKILFQPPPILANFLLIVIMQSFFYLVFEVLENKFFLSNVNYKILKKICLKNENVWKYF